MKKSRSRDRGFDLAVADLFLNFAVALVVVLFAIPDSKPKDLVPKPEEPPVVENPGQSPRAGREVMRITLSPKQSGAVTFRGENWSFLGADSLRLDSVAERPDLLSLKIHNDQAWSSALAKAVDLGIPIVVEFER